MRATRGLLATLGVSTCLVLAGTLALLSVSAVVAFQGWPGLDTTLAANAPAELTAMAGRPVPPSINPSEAEAVVIAAVRPATPAASTRTISPRTNTRPSGRTRYDTRVVAAPAHPPTIASVRARPGVTPAAVPDPPQVGRHVRKVGGGLGGAVTKTGKSLSDGVSELSPGLAGTLDAVTQAVGNTVNGLGGIVAGILDKLIRIPAQR